MRRALCTSLRFAAQQQRAASEGGLEYLRAVADEAAFLRKEFAVSDSSELSDRLGAIKLSYDSGLTYSDMLREEVDLVEMAKDPDLKEMAEEELQQLRKSKSELEEAFDEDLILVDEGDELDVILETEGGAGGAEGGLFAQELFAAYKDYAGSMGWTFKVVTDTTSDDYAPAEGTTPVNGARVQGQDVYRHLKWEEGVHRVQRVPATESGGRLHTSTAGVRVMPAFETMPFELNYDDLHVMAMRSTGAGGQSVNSTNTQCKVRHVPTGLTSNSESERCYAMNKELALKKLTAKLWKLHQDEEAAKKREIRGGSTIGLDRHNKIRTYNWPRMMVTDHRLPSPDGNFTVPGFFEENAVADLITALQLQDQNERRGTWLAERSEALRALPKVPSATDTSS